MSGFWQTLLAVAALATPQGADAGERAAWIRGTTDRDALGYRRGEEMTFTLTLEGGDGTGREIAWRRTGDDGRVAEGRGPASEPVIVKTSLLRPGFVRVYAELVRPGERQVGYVGRDVPKGIVFFDGGAGADVRDIRQGAAEPKDFDSFWACHRARLARVPMTGARCEELPSKNPNVKIHAVTIPCVGANPSTGYLLVPAADGKYPARVGFYGYATSWSRKATAAPDGTRAKADRIELLLSAHGFELNREEAHYRELQKKAGSNGYGHAFDPAQNADPETAYFCGMTYRVMRGLEYVRSRPEWDGKNLTVTGSSQGGLQSIWGAALDPAVTACEVEVPWGCDFGGTEVGRNRGTWYVEWASGLGYYDAVSMARRIPATCRVTVRRAGLGDYTCPPSGVMAFYNALACPKRIVWFQGGTHSVVPPEPVRFEMAERMSR